MTTRDRGVTLPSGIVPFYNVRLFPFLAAGDGVTDDSPAFQTMVTMAAATGNKMYAPAGTYKFLSTVQKLSSFYCPDMVGDGPGRTIFSGASLGANPFFRISGGSGGLTYAEWSGLSFYGNNNSIGVEIQGQGGVFFRRCLFDLNLVGVLFHNKNSGEFTEFCEVTDSEFTLNCVTAVEYRVTAGNDSFHGSGLRNCLVNSNSLGTPIIKVGDGALVYNAPLEITVFPRTATTYLIQNLNTGAPKNCNWFGTIRIEANGASKLVCATGAAASRTFFTGPVHSLHENWGWGTMVPTQNVTVQSDGNVRVSTRPYRIQVATAFGTGTAIDIGLTGWASAGVGDCRLAYVTLIGANYRYSHLLLLSLASGAGGSNTVAVLGTGASFNVAGWGAATFTLDSNNKLVVTNASGGFSVTANISISSVGDTGAIV